MWATPSSRGRISMQRVLTRYLSPVTERYEIRCPGRAEGYIYVSQSVKCLCVCTSVCVTCVMHLHGGLPRPAHFIDCLCLCFCLCCSRFVSLLPLASTAVALNTHMTYRDSHRSIYISTYIYICVYLTDMCATWRMRNMLNALPLRSI